MAALYLEDYLELIEQLPAELRDRFTEMRELDLEVESESKKSEERRRSFFHAAPSMTPEERKKQYLKIREESCKIIEDSDEKVNLANSMHACVERYLRKLDAELGKFKLELEADNPGITEILEKKVLDSEKASYNHLKQEKKKRSHSQLEGKMNGVGSRSNSLPTTPAVLPSRGVVDMIQASPGMANGQRMMVSPNAPSDVYSSGSLRDVSPQGQRKPPSYGEMRSISVSGVSPFPARAPQSSFLHAFEKGDPRTGRPRKLTSRVGEMLKEAVHRQEHRGESGHFLSPSTSYSSMGGASGSGPSSSRGYSGSSRKHDGHYSADEEESDPNEPRYCICNQISYGEMVACDNKDCPFEWFHYACVGITQPPKGKWYCPQCTQAMKRRASRMLQALQNS